MAMYVCDIINYEISYTDIHVRFLNSLIISKVAYQIIPDWFKQDDKRLHDFAKAWVKNRSDKLLSSLFNGVLTYNKNTHDFKVYNSVGGITNRDDVHIFVNGKFIDTVVCNKIHPSDDIVECCITKKMGKLRYTYCVGTTKLTISEEGWKYIPDFAKDWTHRFLFAWQTYVGDFSSFIEKEDFFFIFNNNQIVIVPKYLTTLNQAIHYAIANSKMGHCYVFSITPKIENHFYNNFNVAHIPSMLLNSDDLLAKLAGQTKIDGFENFNVGVCVYNSLTGVFTKFNSLALAQTTLQDRYVFQDGKLIENELTKKPIEHFHTSENGKLICELTKKPIKQHFHTFENVLIETGTYANLAVSIEGMKLLPKWYAENLEDLLTIIKYIRKSNGEICKFTTVVPNEQKITAKPMTLKELRANYEK